MRRAHSIESGINMRDGTSTAEDAKSAGHSPLRLRLGVFLVLLWLVPFWALGPYIAHLLSGLIPHQLPLSRRPSSLCRRSSGCSDSGSPERKSSRSSRARPKGMPSRPSGPYSFTARSEVTATLALIPKRDGHHRATPSYIARLRTRVPTTPPVAVRLSVAAESSGLDVDPIGPGCVAWLRHRAVPQRSVRVPS